MHAVQFFESEKLIFRSVAEFVFDGLVKSEACIVVASPVRIEGIKQSLISFHVDVDAAIASRSLHFFDAVEMLTALMDGRRPNLDKISETFGPLLDSLSDFSGIRGYGEMVTLLIEQGNLEAGLETEKFWDDYAKTRPLKILCGYSLKSFSNDVDDDSISRICDLHTHVIPPPVSLIR